jgi:hypothetical protein
MVFLFENEKILQQAEFKRINTLFADSQSELNNRTPGYVQGGTGCQSLVLTNYRIILLNGSGEDYPGNRLLMKNRSNYMELSYIFYGKETFIQFVNTIIQKHKQLYDSFLPEKGAGAFGEALKLISVRRYFPHIKVVSGVGYEVEKHRDYNFTYFNSLETSIPAISKKQQYVIKLLDILPCVIEQAVVNEKAQKKISAWFARRAGNMAGGAAPSRSNILLLEPLKNNDTFGGTFMKTLIGSTKDVQSTFNDSKQCASYYQELFKNAMLS